MMTSKLFLTALLVCGVSAPAFAGHGGDHSDKARHWFVKMDANGDGVVSKAEHQSFSAKKYYTADRNNDGVITFDEFMNAKHRKGDGYKTEDGFFDGMDKHNMNK